MTATATGSSIPGSSPSTPFPESITTDTHGGNDRVEISLVSDLVGELDDEVLELASGTLDPRGFDPADETLTLDTELGSGDDRFLLNSMILPPVTANGSNSSRIPVPPPDGGDIIHGGDLVCEVEGSDGKDTITFDLTRTSIECSEVFLHAQAGNHDDTVNLKLPDFEAFGPLVTAPRGRVGVAEAIIGCVVEEDIKPTASETRGKFPELPTYIPSNLQVTIDVGGGLNTLNQTLNTVIEGSIVHVDVDGGGDRDIVNDLQSFAVLDALRLQAPLAEGEDPRGIPGAIVDARYELDIDLGGGDDKYNSFIDFRIPPLTERVVALDFDGEAVFNIHGDVGRDEIKVKDANPNFVPAPEDHVAELAGLLEFNLWGGESNDNVQLDLDPGSSIAMQGGTFRANVSGDAGNDFVRIDVVFQPGRIREPEAGLGYRGPFPADDSVIDLTLRGGSGDDRIGFMFQLINFDQTSNSVVTSDGRGPVFFPPGFFGPRGYALLDGGSGTDRWDTEGNGPFEVRGAETEDDTIEDPYLGAPLVEGAPVAAPVATATATVPVAARRVSRLT